MYVLPFLTCCYIGASPSLYLVLAILMLESTAPLFHHQQTIARTTQFANTTQTKNLMRYLNQYHTACPNTKIVLAGYSAGAVIVMNGVCGASEKPWANSNPLPSKWAKTSKSSTSPTNLNHPTQPLHPSPTTHSPHPTTKLTIRPQ